MASATELKDVEKLQIVIAVLQAAVGIGALYLILQRTKEKKVEALKNGSR